MKIQSASSTNAPSTVENGPPKAKPLLGSVASLAQNKDLPPTALALTHQFCDIRIQSLRLASEASGNSSSGNSSIDHEIRALETLKDNGFQPIRKDALTIPLSGKGFGGGKNEEALARANKFAQLGADIAKYKIAIEIVSQKQDDLEGRLDGLDPKGTDYIGFLAAIDDCDTQMVDLENKIKVARAQINNLSKDDGAGSSRN